MPRERLRALLEEARRRTLELVGPVCEADMDRQHSPLMSPLAWDLGHIAAFEDLWLTRAVPGLRPLRPQLWDVYDATETPRSGRGELPFLRFREALGYLEEVHDRALDVLEAVDVSGAGNRLNAGGLVWHLLIEHEHQHNETMLQTLQLAGPEVLHPRRVALPDAPAHPVGDEMVAVEGGPCVIGAPPEGFAYDNERPRHEAGGGPFLIDRTPVTNGELLAFVEDGGYRRRRWWSEEGWSWRRAEGIERPLFWTGTGEMRSFDRSGPIDPALPVMHVSWFEADAFARSRGKRLPTELEWEKAATWDPALGVKRRFPWGSDLPNRARANIEGRALGPAPAGAYPDGASACGVLGMVGDVWEWTGGEFGPYPGFRAHPYREYSEIFFGAGYRPLRGGSWATRLQVARPTFRNWDLPERRQIFAGFRCAADG